MKASLFILGLILSSTAFAGEQDPCQKFMACGTYEGEGNDLDANGEVQWEFTERWEISKVNEKTLRVKQAMFDKEEPKEEIYSIDLEISFNEEGVYEIRREDNSLFANGVCREMACNFNFMPRIVTHEGKDYVVLNVNTFRFTKGKLQRWMMAHHKLGKPGLQTATLTKK